MSACRILLVTFGTLGDLHPFIGLAQSLQQRGADPLLVSGAEYRERVERTGVAFAALRAAFADVERDLGWSREEITRCAVADPRFLYDKLVFPYLEPAFEDLRPMLAGCSLVLFSTVSFAALVAAPVLSALKWLTRPLMSPVIQLRRRAGLQSRRAHPQFEGQCASFGECSAISLHSAA